MNIPLIGHLFGKREPLPHVVVRHVVATRQESRKALTRRIHTELQLGVAVAQLTPEQKAQAIARASQSRSLGRGDMGKGS